MADAGSARRPEKAMQWTNCDKGKIAKRIRWWISHLPIAVRQQGNFYEFSPFSTRIRLILPEF
jgi:hypothetical protein